MNQANRPAKSDALRLYFADFHTWVHFDWKLAGAVNTLPFTIPDCTCYLPFRLYHLFAVPIAPTVHCSDCTYCLLFRLYLLFTVPIVPIVYCSDCTYCLLFRLYLLFTVPIVPIVYCSDCTYCLLFRLYLLFTVPIAPTVHCSELHLLFTVPIASAATEPNLSSEIRFNQTRNASD
ncbi:hypothetical protein MsAc7_18150 [Methanolapillus millepedarum]|uniref:Uncharacterized protein n=1 Tax=Methanolapillus millepedarum TaxID=3028296 RepID=A0AA96ZV21_9EURY|nr:hypothetical protein MsAc7_18150 [Methanosarcinaceae archaeon Ac7]